MKKKMRKLMSLLLLLCIVLPFAACGSQDGGQQSAAQVDAGALVEALRTNVKFETDMEDVSEFAQIAYAGLPAGAKVVRYSGNARYADELTWVAVEKEEDLNAAMEIVDGHLEDMRNHFVSYQQDQVGKLDNPFIWKNSKNIILCITADQTAKTVMENPSEYVKVPAASEPVSSSGGDETEPDADPDTQPPTDAPTEPEASYPVLTSRNDTISHHDSYMVVDNTGYEYYNYSQSHAENYAMLVSKTANALKGETTVYSMVIPTAVGITFPDNMAEKYSAYENQQECLDKIFAKMDSSVVPVNLYDKLMQHREEYLYFRTDWHWTGVGAYYGYEKFCEVKGITPYTLEQRQEHVSDGYVGLFSSGTTADTIYAYDPYFKDDVTFVYTDANGNSAECAVIRDDLAAYWYVFAAGDQPYSVFTNTAVTDGSVAIVVKESFGCALMSYICDHYSTVYEIDYRYWQGNLVDFAREVGADDIIFANNIGMVRSGYLIDLLAKIIA